MKIDSAEDSENDNIDNDEPADNLAAFFDDNNGTGDKELGAAAAPNDSAALTLAAPSGDNDNGTGGNELGAAAAAPNDSTALTLAALR